MGGQDWGLMADEVDTEGPRPAQEGRCDIIRVN